MELERELEITLTTPDSVSFVREIAGKWPTLNRQYLETVLEGGSYLGERVCLSLPPKKTSWWG